MDVEHCHKKEHTAKTTQRHVGVCRGSLGEFFQGLSVHTENEIVVVSSLIPKYSWVYFTPQAHSSIPISTEVAKHPERYKAFKALTLYCHKHGEAVPIGYWHFNSDLQISRGMASSTADIVAMLRCAASYFSRELPVDEIVHILAKIERSDSVFLDTPALFCSSGHHIINQFDKAPPLYALYMHEAETVETEGTKTKLLDYYQQNKKHYYALYQKANNALSNKDLAEICRVSTQSAQLSQEVLPKKNFNNIFKAMPRFNANGMITAHTGSIIGMLFHQPPSISCLQQVGKFYHELGGHCQYTEIGT